MKRYKVKHYRSRIYNPIRGKIIKGILIAVIAAAVFGIGWFAYEPLMEAINERNKEIIEDDPIPPKPVEPPFEPLPEEFETATHHDLKSVGANVNAFHYKFPDYVEADIAIFGVLENRGKSKVFSEENPADVIRRRLYSLKTGTSRYRISDLGNLRPGITLEDTYFRIREVVETLVANNTIPVILGSS